MAKRNFVKDAVEGGGRRLAYTMPDARVMNLELEIARALSTYGASGGGSNKPRPPGPDIQGRELTYDDVRDERIEVAAQHSLVRLSKKTPAERQAATEMLTAIKGGQLAAIYQENMTSPAKRARAAGGNWWDITQGRDAVMQNDPYGIEAPILVFRAAAANDPDSGRLDRALVTAWGMAAPPHPNPSTIPAQSIVAWINIFLPCNAPNASLIKDGLFKGKTMIGPPSGSLDEFFSEPCFLSNQRTFSANRNAPSVAQAIVAVDVRANGDLRVVQRTPKCLPAKPIDCRPPPTAWPCAQNGTCQIQIVGGGGGWQKSPLSIKVKMVAINACANFDFVCEGTIVLSTNPSGATLSFNGSATGFPAYEMYALGSLPNNAGSSPCTVFQHCARTGNADNWDSSLRPVRGSVQLPGCPAVAIPGGCDDECVSVSAIVPGPRTPSSRS